MDFGSSNRKGPSIDSISRAAIDAWSSEIRQARARSLRRVTDNTSTDMADTPGSSESELDLAYEELSVAEAELRAQYEQLASTQLQLERERARYRDLFEHAPVPYIVTDPAGTIVDANIAAATLFGPDADRLRGKPLQSFIPLSARSRFRQSLVELAGAHVVPEMVFVVSTRHAQRRVVNATVSVVRTSDGKLSEVRWLLYERSGSTSHEFQGQVRASAVERLVSLRTAELEQQVIEQERLAREAEEARRLAEQASRDAVELLTTVSHELRTPVSAIAGYAELLSMGAHGPLTSAQHVDVERILATLDHIIGLLDNLLLYFRAGGGTLPVDLHHIPIEPTVRSVVSLVQPMVDAKGVCLTVDASESTCVVYADGDRLRQILLNLVANALKFTRANGTIHLCWREKSDAIELDVTDDGVGIPASQLERIFKPFVQLDTKSHLGAGFGLGLAISRGLARAMGGDLMASSETRHGSTFTLRLPKHE